MTEINVGTTGFSEPQADVPTYYANYISINGMTADLRIDFGKHRLPSTPVTELAVYVSYQTAKQMIGLLHSTISRYEEVYGLVNVEPKPGTISP